MLEPEFNPFPELETLSDSEPLPAFESLPELEPLSTLEPASLLDFLPSEFSDCPLALPFTIVSPFFSSLVFCS